MDDSENHFIRKLIKEYVTSANERLKILKHLQKSLLKPLDIHGNDQIKLPVILVAKEISHEHILSTCDEIFDKVQKKVLSEVNDDKLMMAQIFHGMLSHCYTSMSIPNIGITNWMFKMSDDIIPSLLKNKIHERHNESEISDIMMNVMDELLDKPKEHMLQDYFTTLLELVKSLLIMQGHGLPGPISIKEEVTNNTMLVDKSNSECENTETNNVGQSGVLVTAINQKIVLEMKGFIPLISLFNEMIVTKPEKQLTKCSEMVKILQQALARCYSSGTNKMIISSFYETIYIEIDGFTNLKYSHQDNEVAGLNIKYHCVKNLEVQKATLKQIMTYILHKIVTEQYHHDKQEGLPISDESILNVKETDPKVPTFSGTTIVTTQEEIDNNTIQCRPDFHSNVYIFKREELFDKLGLKPEILGEEGPLSTSKIILKVHCFKPLHFEEWEHERALERCTSEYQVLKFIMNHNKTAEEDKKINAPNLLYKNVLFLNRNEIGLLRTVGYGLLMEEMDGFHIDMLDKHQRDLFDKQIDNAKDIGLVHNDLSDGNVLYDESSDTVSIIDWTLASINIDSSKYCYDMEEDSVPGFDGTVYSQDCLFLANTSKYSMTSKIYI